MKLHWSFPPTSGGVSQGFHDSGQAIFGADAWDKTVREIIQNSLDAVRDSGKPVTVRISRMQVPSSEIGAADLATHIESALKRTRRDGYERGVKFFQRALKILKKRQIPTLAIVDSNTSGLVGQKWNALVHEEGTSSKGTMKAAGGSFGIGKNAPYLISGVKTICYSTRYLDRGRQEWFIARSKISAHQDPKQPGRELQHIGFGTKSKVAKGERAPPTRGKEIYRGFRLAEPGTGIFIVGSDIPESWISKSEQSLARNFFAAIHEKKLEIVIDQRRLDYETLDSVFESDKKHRTYHYYGLMRGSKPAYVEGEFGKFEVYLSTDEEDAPNRMAYVNRRGMMITDVRQFGKNPFHTSVGQGWAQYAVVVRAADDKTDERVRAMEPPSHDSIEYERINDRDHAKVRGQLKEIQKKIEQLTLDALNQSGKSGETVLSEIDALGEEGPDGSGNGKSDHNLTIRTIRTRHKKTMDKPDGPGHEIIIGGTPDRGREKGDPKPPKEPSSETAIKGISSLDRQRVMRHRNKIRVAFTPRADSVHFALKPAGEEPKRQRSISIKQAKIVMPVDVWADVKDDVVSIRAGDCPRVIVDLEVDDDAAYTGYEILEYVVPGGAR